MALARRTLTATIAYWSGVVMGGAGIAIAPSGRAQAVNPAAAPVPEKIEKLDQFVVIGSYIPTAETAFSASIAPVVRIAQKEIEESGLTTTAELLQRLSVSNGGAVPVANHGAGFTPSASSISLRGLGPEATLVLINGRRVANFPVGNGGTTAFVDLNTIPLAAVDTIEVLKDGASAIYGADAVAGLVNIKMKRGMDGTQALVKYGNTTRRDSSEVTAVLMTGVQTETGDAMVGLNYYRRGSMFNSDRAYSAVPPFLSASASPANLNLTREVALEAGVPAGLLPADAGGAGAAIFAAAPDTATNRGEASAASYRFGTGRPSMFNYNEFSMSYPQRQNMGAFAYGDRKVFGTENIRAYLDVNYQTALTHTELAPPGTNNFSGAGTEIAIPARTTTPLPGPDGRTRVAATGAYNPFNPFNQDITGASRARFVEAGNRTYRNRTDAALLTAGLRGDGILTKWNFDTGYSFSAVHDRLHSTLLSARRFNRLLNAADPFFQPGSPDYLGTTRPYNPFGYYRVSIPNNARVVGAALVTTKDVNASTLHQLNAVVSSGSLLDLPAGAVGFALGLDFRHEQLRQYPDHRAAAGDLIGAAPRAQAQGRRTVGGSFLEGSIPLLKNVPGAHDLSATVAVRHEYFTAEKAGSTVPKLGLRWQPFGDALAVRASWSMGSRLPSLFELYSTPTTRLMPIQHPLTGRNEPEQEVTVAGNRGLAAEKTNYLNAGVLWSPQFASLKGLTMGVDYWEANRRGTVTSHYQDTVNRFFGHTPDGAPAPGGLLPGESVALGATGDIERVNAVFFNLGETNVAGFDYSLNYLARINALGRFAFSTTWSQYMHFRQRTALGGPFIEVVNQPAPLGTRSDDGYLRWRGRTQIEAGYKSFATVFGTTYTDGFWDRDLNGDAWFVRPTWIYDAQVSFNLTARFPSWLTDTKIALGARNLFDQDPPYAAGFGANATGYPGFLYTPEGRFVYLSLSRKF